LAFAGTLNLLTHFTNHFITCHCIYHSSHLHVRQLLLLLLFSLTWINGHLQVFKNLDVQVKHLLVAVIIGGFWAQRAHPPPLPPKTYLISRPCLFEWNVKDYICSQIIRNCRNVDNNLDFPWFWDLSYSTGLIVNAVVHSGSCVP